MSELGDALTIGGWPGGEHAGWRWHIVEADGESIVAIDNKPAIQADREDLSGPHVRPQNAVIPMSVVQKIAGSDGA